MKKTVIELFAGVGGFRCGLNKAELKNNKVIEKQEEVSVAPAASYVVSAPVTQCVAAPTVEKVASANQSVKHVEQTFPENVNIFDQGVNIFDQAPQTPSNGGQIKM